MWCYNRKCRWPSTTFAFRDISTCVSLCECAPSLLFSKITCYPNVEKQSFCVKARHTWLHQRREKMLFAFKRLRNISLASLSAECQDSVCKQSVHVRVVTWRKLLSCCPRSLTPEVNPDIDTYSASNITRRCTAPESYHFVITPNAVGRPTRLVGGEVVSGFANTDYVVYMPDYKMLVHFTQGCHACRYVTQKMPLLFFIFQLMSYNISIAVFHHRRFLCLPATLELPVKNNPQQETRENQ